MLLHEPITSLKGVGDKSASRLKKLGIKTVGDLLYHFPRRYEDYSRVVAIKDAHPGTITIKGEITQIHTRRTRNGRSITTALIDDGSGSMQAVWFNQPYLSHSLPKNIPIYAAGKLAFAYNQFALQSPTIERVSRFPKNAARIVPVYPETEGISSKQVRYWLQQLFPVQVEDPLPENLRDSYDLIEKTQALTQMHFPSSMEDMEQAHYRLAFEELYILLLAFRSIKDETEQQKAPQLTFEQSSVQSLVDNLPFSLTDSQRKSAWQIIKDMQRTRPMNRLLQGDVGSGKTVVAAIAAAVVSRNKYQTAILAPTAVLAEQHYRVIQDILAPIGIKVALLTGATKDSERKAILQQLLTNEVSVCIGTHALFEDEITFSQLGYIVVDEQHRFGVQQRNRLQSKTSITPHFLSMTATPIPRSLALTIYGDLDISFLTDMPPGRKPVTTYVTTNTRWVYGQLEEILGNDGQIYVVCPLIAESDTLGVKSVEQEIRTLRQYLPNTRIAGLNGRMKPAEKTDTMKRFKSGQIDVLVSTTVVEVGVDVPNAKAIVVEGAERFGLATLHQLRGRVGRNASQAYCYLKPTSTIYTKKRLQLMEQYHDGRLLAEKDLQLRGAGELYGQRQHGMLDMQLVKLTDTELINTVRKAVAETPTLDTRSPLFTLVEQKKKQKHLN